MEKTLSVILICLSLFVGIIGGLVIAPSEVEIQEVEVPVVEYIDVPVPFEVTVPSAVAFKDKAIEDFMLYVDDEELFDCDGHEYDFDEISIKRVYDDYALEFNDEDYTVEFSLKLDFDEDDERSCKLIYDVEALYEEDEEVDFIVA